MRWVIAGLLAIALASPASADYDAGMVAFDKGDLKLAFKEFSLAAEHGDAAAQNALGVFYCFGLGASKDYAKAVYWYHKAAELGYNKAKAHLGEMYSEGAGVPKDYRAAFYWFKLAARQGDSLGEHRLALCYLTGEGINKNIDKYYYWERRAAEHGNAYAQQMMANLNASGYVKNASQEKATHLYHEAAKQGSTHAQCLLGIRYLRGLGVEKNKILAYKWIYLASLNGPDKGRGSCKWELNEITATMTPEEIAQSREMALEWDAKNKQNNKMQQMLGVLNFRDRL